MRKPAPSSEGRALAVPMSNVIINLPGGGLAVVIRDEIANTCSTLAHDGARVSYAATNPEALTLLAMVAAPDDRDLETLKRVYSTAEIVTPKPYQRTRVGESTLDAYNAAHPEPSWPTLRAFAMAEWESLKGDYSWPEFWSAVADEVVRRAFG